MYAERTQGKRETDPLCGASKSSSAPSSVCLALRSTRKVQAREHPLAVRTAAQADHPNPTQDTCAYTHENKERVSSPQHVGTPRKTDRPWPAQRTQFTACWWKASVASSSNVAIPSSASCGGSNDQIFTELSACTYPISTANHHALTSERKTNLLRRWRKAGNLDERRCRRSRTLQQQQAHHSSDGAVESTVSSTGCAAGSRETCRKTHCCRTRSRASRPPVSPAASRCL